MRMRGAVALAYLLARVTDTIADVEGVEAEMKVQALDALAAREFTKLESLINGILPLVESAKEQQLLSLTEVLVAKIGALDEVSRHEVEKVCGIILDGQRGDIERFEIQGGCIEDQAALLHYCYQVAGCVGEFWTAMGLYSDKRYSALPEEELYRLGRAYGEGLQLVNIIRDAPKDLKQGRVYIPGMTQLDCVAVAPWIKCARENLLQGIEYSDSLAGRFQRLATYLPASLGLETIDRINLGGKKAWQNGAKVSRSLVYREMLSGFFRPQSSIDIKQRW